MVCHRPYLIDLLLSKIPKDKLHYGKRVVSIAQDAHGAVIHCADGHTHFGSIVVGSDGAYSSVCARACANSSIGRAACPC